MAWPVAERAGKVFIDHQMNRAGANIASVYSLRPLPGAPVSTPLDWDELDDDLEPGDFRIDNVWERFAAGDRFARSWTTSSRCPRPWRPSASPPAPRPPRERSRPRFPPSGRPAPQAGPAWTSTPPSGTSSAPREPSAPRNRDAPEPHPPVDGAPTGRVADGGNGGDRLSTAPPRGRTGPRRTRNGLPSEAHPAGLTEVAALNGGRRFTIQQHHAGGSITTCGSSRTGCWSPSPCPSGCPRSRGCATWPSTPRTTRSTT